MELVRAMTRGLRSGGIGRRARRPSRLGATAALLAAFLAFSTARRGSAQVQVFNDENAYRAALASAGAATLSEGFEGTAWDGARSTIAGGSSTAASVTSQGISWSASAGVTTNDLSPHSGTWRAYDHPGGAPDTLKGASTVPLRGVGGWFTSNTPPASLRILVDGAAPDNARLQLSSGYQFLGVVSAQGFTRFEIVGDGTAEDEKHWFADDLTFGLDGSASLTGAVPGVAAVSGLRGSDWHSDLWIHNGGDASVSVELFYAPAGSRPQLEAPYPLVVAADETRAIRDVVNTAFGLGGTVGSLLYDVTRGDAGRLVVRADTYNRLDPHQRYGQNVPGVAFASSLPAGTTLVVPGSPDPTQYRYNLGVQSAGGRSALVRVVDAGSGLILHTATVALETYGWAQVVDLQRSYGLPPGSMWYVEVEGLDGPVLASASLVDQQSNDGVQLAGRALRSNAGSLWLPGAAHVVGRLGSTWRSDLVSVNPHGLANGAAVAFFPRGAPHPDGRPSASAALDLEAYRQTAVDDVLATLLRLPDGSAGALRLIQDPQLPLLHVLRTYNDTVDAHGRHLTYGSATPAVPLDELVGDGEEARIAGVQHDGDTRANLTLANAHVAADGAPSATTVELDLLAANGTSLGRQSVTLGPFENVQVDSFPEGILGAGAELRDATLVLRAGRFQPGDTGGLLAMVSLVNGNRTPGVGTSDPQAVVAVKVRVAAP